MILLSLFGVFDFHHNQNGINDLKGNKNIWGDIYCHHKAVDTNCSEVKWKSKWLPIETKNSLIMCQNNSAPKCNFES